MIGAARERLGDGAELHVADLSTLRPRATGRYAILSTATFHWIADHDALFAGLHAHLRPGGLLVAQCGGQGNIATVHAGAREVMRRRALRAELRGLARPVELRRARRDRGAPTRSRLRPGPRAGCRSVR